MTVKAAFVALHCPATCGAIRVPVGDIMLTKVLSEALFTLHYACPQCGTGRVQTLAQPHIALPMLKVAGVEPVILPDRPGYPWHALTKDDVLDLMLEMDSGLESLLATDEENRT